LKLLKTKQVTSCKQLPQPPDRPLPAVALIIGGFSISTAFSKYGFEVWILANVFFIVKQADAMEINF
jgi:hypothetical protein